MSPRELRGDSPPVLWRGFPRELASNLAARLAWYLVAGHAASFAGGFP